MIIFSSKFDNPNIRGQSYSIFLTLSGRKAASQRGRFQYSTPRKDYWWGNPSGNLGESVLGEAFLAFLRVQNGFDYFSQ
jgi:hypothetical protein